MEKYSQDKETLLLNLRNEEAQLMTEMAKWMGQPTKTSAESQKASDIETRLHQVRGKITELDLVKE